MKCEHKWIGTGEGAFCLECGIIKEDDREKLDRS